MTGSCEACGAGYTARTRAQRFCSGRCRTRYHRGARAPLTAVAPSAPGPVEQAAERQLAAAGRLDTVAGQLAVVLARRLDDSERDTGAGLAAVSKALRGVLDTLSAQDAPDLVDELKARRDLKRGRAS